MSATLHLTPDDALTDVPVGIRASGLPSHAVVRVSASLDLPDRGRLESWADVVTDAHGRVDLARATPIAGTYRVADALGLVWSLAPVAALASDADSPLRVGTPFTELDLDPYRIELTVRHRGTPLASGTLIRRVVADGVSRTPVRDDGLVGTLFLPAGPGPHPVLVVLPGSGGGVPERQAALYASRGYATLALAYFHEPEGILPAALTEIPLEYFGAAFAWLKRRDDLDHEHLTLVGRSRGGELALLLGATFPEVTAVVAWVPSVFLWGEHAQPGGDPVGTRSTWTHRGENLPFVPVTSTQEDFVPRDGVLAHVGAFQRNVENHLAAALDSPARIPVERIGGPILLLSGRDDALWPASWFAAQAVEQLDAAGFAHEVTHLDYPGAGHTISPGLEPTTFLAMGDATTPESFHLGGSPQGVAEANADLWPRLLAFLDRHARSPRSGATANSTPTTSTTP